MSAPPITGTVLAGSHPEPGATVLAIRGRDVLDVATSDGEGGFALTADGPVTVLAKVRSRAVGLACAETSPGDPPVSLEVGPLHTVTVQARGEIPDGFDLQLAPRELAGLSPEQVGLMHVPVDQMSESMLARRPLSAEAPLEFELQEGVWLLYAALDWAPDALGQDTQRRAWRVQTAALATGEPLALGPVGHLLEVAGDVTVVLDVVEIPVT